MEERMVRQFTQAMGLDAEQQERVRAELRASRQEVWRAMEEYRPKIQAIRTASYQRLRAILRPDQYEAFDRLIQSWESAWQRRRGSRRGWPPPP